MCEVGEKGINDARCDVSTVTSLCSSATGTGAGDAQLNTEDATGSFIFEETDDKPQRTLPPTSDAVSASHFSKIAIFVAFVGDFAVMISDVNTVNNHFVLKHCVIDRT